MASGGSCRCSHLDIWGCEGGNPRGSAWSGGSPPFGLSRPPTFLGFSPRGLLCPQSEGLRGAPGASPRGPGNVSILEQPQSPPFSFTRDRVASESFLLGLHWNQTDLGDGKCHTEAHWTQGANLRATECLSLPPVTSTPGTLQYSNGISAQRTANLNPSEEALGTEGKQRRQKQGHRQKL